MYIKCKYAVFTSFGNSAWSILTHQVSIALSLTLDLVRPPSHTSDRVSFHTRLTSPIALSQCQLPAALLLQPASIYTTSYDAVVFYSVTPVYTVNTCPMFSMLSTICLKCTRRRLTNTHQHSGNHARPMLAFSALPLRYTYCILPVIHAPSIISASPRFSFTWV